VYIKGCLCPLCTKSHLFILTIRRSLATYDMLCRYMKLRLDRCLRFDLGSIPDSEALAVGGKVPEFQKPEKWTAPYPGYTPGWWEKFYPKQ